MKPICSNLTLKRLFCKLIIECTYHFNSKFFKQMDGCSMSGPLSVTLLHIYMIKAEIVLNGFISFVLAFLLVFH